MIRESFMVILWMQRNKALLPSHYHVYSWLVLVWYWHQFWQISWNTRPTSWSVIDGQIHQFKSCSVVLFWLSQHHYAAPCSRKRHQFLLTAWNRNCAIRFARKTHLAQLFSTIRACKMYLNWYIPMNLVSCFIVYNVPAQKILGKCYIFCYHYISRKWKKT